MEISAHQLGRHSRLQTVVTVSVLVAALGIALLLSLGLHYDQWAAWSMGFGVGFGLCRVVHGSAERRFVGREPTRMRTR